MLINPGKETLGIGTLRNPGTDKLLYQRKFKQGMLFSGQRISFKYNISGASNGDTLFEVRIYKQGVAGYSSLTHTKNARNRCDLVDIWDPEGVYTIKIVSKTSNTNLIIRTVQIREADTILIAGNEYIRHTIEAESSVAGNSTPYVGTTINYGVTFAAIPLIFGNGQSNSGIYGINYNSPSTTATNLYIRRLDGANTGGTIYFNYRIVGGLSTPALLP